MRRRYVFAALVAALAVPLLSGAGRRVPAPPSVDGAVTCFAAHDGALYAGGAFRHAGADSAGGLLRFDGARWSGLRTEPVCEIRTVASVASLLAGGRIVTAAGHAVNAGAYRGAWIPGAPGTFDDVVHAVSGYRGAALYGGAFTAHVATADGRALGGGADGVVRCLHVWRGRLVAGGYFTHAGGVEASGIAAWDGSAWKALGPGFDGPVYCLATWRGHLIAGGSFARSDTAACANLAVWDGTAWRPLGGGAPGPVSALLGAGGTLGVGGYFGREGDRPAPGLRWWDGARWRVSQDVPSPVQALARYRGVVYAGVVPERGTSGLLATTIPR